MLGSMKSTLAEVLDAARALPREERAEVAEEMLATLDSVDDSNAARYAALQAAVDRGIASLDAGRTVKVQTGGVREFLQERGRLATQRAETKQA
jgi:hypothetical protein